jgi:LacI family transcriptional regulator
VFQVASWLEKNELTNYTLIGYDLLEQTQQFLKKGVIDFLISQKPREQGYKSVMALFNYLVMKKQVIKDQFLPIDIITKENIDFYINQ